MTFNIMAFSIMTFGIITFSKVALLTGTIRWRVKNFQANTIMTKKQ